jgi:diketogulonate reductase-like aldo/keto reductase
MNCPIVMFLEMLTFCHKKPAINYLECHPYFTQCDAQEFYSKLGVPIAAFAPICPSENAKFVPENCKGLDLFKESVIQELAKKYKKTEAQIILNWHMRQNHIVCPGMNSKEHFEQNADVFEFELNKDDVQKINKLDKCARFYSHIQDDNYSQIPYWM